MGGFNAFAATNPLFNRAAGGAMYTGGQGGGMANLGQLLQLMMGSFRNSYGGMSTPNAAGAQGGGFQNPMMQFPQQARGGNQSLMPSVQGAPQLPSLGDGSGANDVAPAAAGGTVPMGNLLTLFKGGNPPANRGMMQTAGIAGAAGNAGRAHNRVFQPEPYPGGLPAKQSFWQGPGGNRSFAVSAK